MIVGIGRSGFCHSHEQRFLFTRTTSQSPRLREPLAPVAITRGNSRSVFSLVADQESESWKNGDKQNASKKANRPVRIFPSISGNAIEGEYCIAKAR